MINHLFGRAIIISSMLLTLIILYNLILYGQVLLIESDISIAIGEFIIAAFGLTYAIYIVLKRPK